MFYAISQFSATEKLPLILHCAFRDFFSVGMKIRIVQERFKGSASDICGG